MPRRVWFVTGLLAVVVGLPGVAAAQAKAGVRAGVSADPDQFYVGGHAETAPILESLTFRPTVELGFGDRVTALALNVEFAYGIPLANQPWRVYVGGGPAANIYWVDGPRESDVGGGFNLLVGLEHRDGLFAEIKVGGIDSPSFKLAVGYTVTR